MKLFGVPDRIYLELLVLTYYKLCNKMDIFSNDIAFLSGLNYCYLSKVCDKHAGISLDRFKAVYQVLYNDLLINGEL